jgi:hypothetical protein
VRPADDQPTLSLCHGHTVLKTTDRLHLPPAALLEDARRGGAQEAVGAGTEVLIVPAAEAIAEPPATLAGHEFVTCLERSPLGEVWRLRGPDGQQRLACCLHRSTATDADLRVRRLQGLDHPALPLLEIVDGPAAQIVLLTAHPTRTLASWFRECRNRGLPGVPPAELLGYLQQAAEALDELLYRHGLQHLDLHPGSLWLDEQRLRLGGFGLVQLLGLPLAGPAAVAHPRYAAPELLRGRVGTRCDQYSLALLYAEAVRGVHPLDGAGGARRGPRGPDKLELGLFSAGERAVLARALHPDPQQRYASCKRLVAGLRAALPAGDSGALPRPGPLPVLLGVGSVTQGPASLDQFVRELLALAAGPAAVRQRQRIHYRLEPGQSLKHRCAVNLFPGAALLKLEGFCQDWQGETVLRERGLFVLSVRTSVGFWERLIGRQVGLEIHVRLMPPARPGQHLSEVGVLIRPFGCGRARAVQLLEEMGPVLLESLRAHLQALPEQRAQERLLWNERLRVHPVVAGLRAADGIDCLGKDISVRGIGIFLPQPLPATHLYVNHPGSPQFADLAALVKVVRGQRCPDGWYEVGALFAPE